MATKPTDDIRWAELATAPVDVEEPSLAAKDDGWPAAPDKPKRNWFNWIMRGYWRWKEYLEDATDEHFADFDDPHNTLPAGASGNEGDLLVKDDDTTKAVIWQSPRSAVLPPYSPGFLRSPGPDLAAVTWDFAVRADGDGYDMSYAAGVAIWNPNIIYFERNTDAAWVSLDSVHLAGDGASDPILSAGGDGGTLRVKADDVSFEAFDSTDSGTLPRPTPVMGGLRLEDGAEEAFDSVISTDRERIILRAVGDDADDDEARHVKVENSVGGSGSIIARSFNGQLKGAIPDGQTESVNRAADEYVHHQAKNTPNFVAVVDDDGTVLSSSDSTSGPSYSISNPSTGVYRVGTGSTPFDLLVMHADVIVDSVPSASDRRMFVFYQNSIQQTVDIHCYQAGGTGGGLAQTKFSLTIINMLITPTP